MKSFIIQILAFIIVLAGHFALSCLGFYNSFGKFESLSIDRYIYSYITALKHWVGISLGLMAFFIVYTIKKYHDTEDISSIKSGIIAFCIILLGGYLIFGIHESTPMFDYFIGLLGYIYVKIQFAMFFIVMFISTFTGMMIIWRKSKKLKHQQPN